MKITAQEEYGLRILLRISRCKPDESMSIPALSSLENISQAYAGKLTRILRQAGYLDSTPGNVGGYYLSKPAQEININEVLKSLGGSLFDQAFCNSYSGSTQFCTNSIDCSARSLWQMIQYTVDQLLNKVTLQDLSSPEDKSSTLLMEILEQKK